MAEPHPCLFFFSSVLASVLVGMEVLLVNRAVAGTEVELGKGVKECSKLTMIRFSVKSN